jgi:hypothetical protein
MKPRLLGRSNWPGCQVGTRVRAMLSPAGTSDLQKPTNHAFIAERHVPGRQIVWVRSGYFCSLMP